jgi:hypothetical protein
MIAGLWLALGWVDAAFFVAVYLPGYVTGLGLCRLHGHFEHAHGTTSHYGRLYNLIFFNDGYHVEHHQRSGEHWTRLPQLSGHDARQSRWPSVLRWLESAPIVDQRSSAVGRSSTVDRLELLEHIVLHSSCLQRYVVASHERAFRRLLRAAPDIRRVTIVGGGLFPRTALVLRKALPKVSLTIVDANERHLEIASRFLDSEIVLRHETYSVCSAPARSEGNPPDLVVIPLAFIGDRERLYREPPAPRVLVHDWIWKRRAEGVVVSWLLLKRLNLVTR